MGRKGEKKASINITIDSGVLERLDAYCKRIGLSRSAYISYMVATSLDSQEQLMGGITNGMVNAAISKE